MDSEIPMLVDVANAWMFRTGDVVRISGKYYIILQRGNTTLLVKKNKGGILINMWWRALYSYLRIKQYVRRIIPKSDPMQDN